MATQIIQINAQNFVSETYKEQDLSFMQNRIWNLTVAVTWCKWFLKVD